MSNDFMSDLDQWVLDSVQAVKQAEERGSTSHPSEKAEDGNQSASTGARASEHEKDVKAQVPGQTVNEAKGTEAAGPGRGENSPVLSTVTESKATGEAPAVETSSAKAKPEDPGTAHPAKADMGEKFSVAQLKSIGDEILADIAVASAVKQSAAECATPGKAKVEALPQPAAPKSGKRVEKKAEETKAEEKAEASGESSGETSSGETSGESAVAIESAEQAGKEAAAAVIEKMAQPVVSKDEIVDSIIKQASVDADNFVDYLSGFMSKKAMDVGDTGNTVMDETSAGQGGAEAGAGAGAGDAEIEQIVQALLEAGVSPEELLALVEGGAQGGGAQGVAPEAAAPDAMPAEAAMPAEMPKIASAEKSAGLKAALLKVIELQSKKGV